MSSESLRLFKSQLSQGPRKRDQILAQILDLIRNGVVESPAIYKAIYPGKPFSEKQIRNLRSELLRRLTHFLTHFHFDECAEKDLYWVRAMLDMNAVKYADNAISKVARTLDAQPLSLRNMQLQAELEEQALHFQLAVEGRKVRDYATMMQADEEAFVARTLFYALCDFQSQIVNIGHATPSDSPLLAACLQAIEAGKWQNIPLIQLYFNAYNLIVHQDSSRLSPLVQGLIEHAAHFSPTELTDVYRLAFNFCIRLANRGED
ncbi:MAG: hypothetical protein AAF570_20825, partial [Bacteroidota bacterium]